MKVERARARARARKDLKAKASRKISDSVDASVNSDSDLESNSSDWGSGSNYARELVSSLHSPTTLLSQCQLQTILGSRV
jgi:hypothetical protein